MKEKFWKWFDGFKLRIAIYLLTEAKKFIQSGIQKCQDRIKEIDAKRENKDRIFEQLYNKILMQQIENTSNALDEVENIKKERLKLKKLL